MLGYVVLQSEILLDILKADDILLTTLDGLSKIHLLTQLQHTEHNAQTHEESIPCFSSFSSSDLNTDIKEGGKLFSCYLKWNNIGEAEIPLTSMWP